MNKQFIRNVGWWISASSLGMTLAVTLHARTVHAGDVRHSANADTHYALTQVNGMRGKPGFKIAPELALQKGLTLLSRAKTPKEHKLAFRYINFAATKGLPEAMFQCALMYLDNEFAPANDDRAMSLLEQASAQGHKQAEIALNYIQFADDGIGC